MSEVTMKAPQGVTSAGAAGVEYKVVKGRVRVALAHVAQLIEHGFEVVVEDVKELVEGGRGKGAGKSDSGAKGTDGDDGADKNAGAAAGANSSATAPTSGSAK